MSKPSLHPVLQHPERIHPALWRATQLARPHHRILSTGYPQLDGQLPGGGWPVSTLIEILPARTGMGEIQLLRPALSRLDPGRSIALVNPPYKPSAWCLNQWFENRFRILWIRSQTPGDTLWAAEKILQHDACAALLCWVDQTRPASLRRLQLAARQGSTLFFGIRPAHAAGQPSTAPLRLHLNPTSFGLDITVLKRRGPVLSSTIPLFLHDTPDSGLSVSSLPHDALDQHISSWPTRPFALAS